MRGLQLPLIRNEAEVISAKALVAGAVARAVTISFRDGAMSTAKLVDLVLHEGAAAAASSPRLARLIDREIRKYLPHHAGGSAAH
jgi:hypothetical protein